MGASSRQHGRDHKGVRSRRASASGGSHGGIGQPSDGRHWEAESGKARIGKNVFQAAGRGDHGPRGAAAGRRLHRRRTRRHVRPYLEDFADTARHLEPRFPDGGAAHQEPLAGFPSFVYVRVHNRGTEAARDPSVKLFQADPASSTGPARGPGGNRAARGGRADPLRRPSRRRFLLVVAALGGPGLAAGQRLRHGRREQCRHHQRANRPPAAGSLRQQPRAARRHRRDRRPVRADAGAL